MSIKIIIYKVRPNNNSTSEYNLLSNDRKHAILAFANIFINLDNNI